MNPPIEPGDEREIAELIGAHLVRVCFDYAVTLEFGRDKVESSLQIEQPFILRMPDATLNLDPESNLTRFGRVIELIRTRVLVATASQGGVLRVEFERDAALTVRTHDRYEAWTFVSSTGTRLVSAPGHGLVTWDPHRPEVPPLH